MTSTRRSLLLALVPLAVLAAVGVLQVRWLDELAAAQLEEGRRSLRLALERAALEIDEQGLGRKRDPDEAVDATVVEAALARALGEDAFERYAFAIERDGDAPRFERGPAAVLEREPDASATVLLEPSGWVSFLGEEGVLGERVDLPVPRGDAGWRLTARRIDAPLAEVVASGRRRNQLLLAGLGAVLVAGIGMLVAAQVRARRLAERELLFVAGVSHELRTPLAVLRSAAANLKDGVVTGPAKVADYGELIEREVERMGTRVERVLRFSGRAEPGARERLGLDELVRESVESCEPWRDRRRFDVACEVEDGLTVEGDRGALLSAVTNLVENAIKYGPDGQTVRVRAARENGAVRLDVTDEGAGVAADEARRVFEPFFRGRAARETAMGGTGLGLGVVAQVAEEHGGSVALTAPSTFSLRLPLANGEVEGAP